jgi:hypothetical protein
MGKVQPALIYQRTYRRLLDPSSLIKEAITSSVHRYFAIKQAISNEKFCPLISSGILATARQDMTPSYTEQAYQGMEE